MPPHPSSFLGKKLEEWAEKKNDLDAYRERQAEVQGYWEKVDEEIIKPILDEYDEDVRGILEKALYLKGEDAEQEQPNEVDDVEPEDVAKADAHLDQEPSKDTDSHARAPLISEASKRLRQAYITAKRAYRIPEQRLNRIQETLDLFLGTQNFHNFTIQKSARDPSAKRVIKSFDLNRTPILINGTEWVSMKVHGQSFMMHQIRKMVGMVALIVRCGCDPSRLSESLGSEPISIPKAPSLGLLLERPVFDSYNKRAQNELTREAIGFDKFKDEMDKFKQEQIYERMYRDEEKDNVFGNFFNHVDNFPCETFLFVTSGGIEATKIPIKPGKEHNPKDDLARAEIDGEDSDGDETKDTHGDEG